MGVDNRAEFILSIGGDGSGISAIFNAFKKTMRSDVAELERITNDVVLFKGIKTSLEVARTAVTDTTAALAKLKEFAKTVEGPGIGKEITKQLKDAEKAARDATKEFERQQAALAKLDTSLTAANVDVKNLALAEEKLAIATRAAAAAAVEQQSKAALGFKTLKDIQPEINKLTAAYQSLRDSGRLTFAELSVLQARYQQSVANLQREVGGLGQAFQEVRGRLIVFAAAFAGAVAGALKAAENFREFTTQLAAIGTIADVSEERLAELGRGVRALARDMGVDAVDAAKALYNIIGSGISPDNSLAVLEKAAKAARAGLTDVHTTAKIGVGILNAYHLRVDDLDHIYDVLFKTVKDGVVQMGELTANFGIAIPAAVAAKVSVEELAAAFVVLTRNLIDAPEAATAIGKAIQDLSAPAPEAAAEMERLGFSFDGLVGSIKQLAALDLAPDQIRRLIPDVRAQRAIINLVQHFKDLNTEAREMVEQSGSFEAAYKRMADTPQAKIDRFNASLKDLSISIGEFVSNANGFVVAMTNMLKGFNELGPKTQQAIISVTALTVGVTALSSAFLLLRPAINLMVGAFASMGAASITAAGGLTAATIALGGLAAAIGLFVGFKVGEVLREWSEAVRFAGDWFGLFAATIDNMVRTTFKAFLAIINLNFGALKQIGAQFLANARDIAGEFWNALTGATERSHNLAEKQKALAEQLKKTGAEATKAAVDVNDAVGRLLGKLEAQQTAVDASLSKIQARLQASVGLLTKAVTEISAAASQELSQAAAAVATKLAALQTTDIQKVRDTVAIQKQAAQERLQILAQFAVDALKAFDSLAASQRAIAVKSKVDLVTVDQEIALARKAKLTEIVAAFRDHVNALLAMQQQHLANVKTLEEQRFSITQTVEEQIRILRQGRLNDYQKYNENLREVDRLTNLAKQELETGTAKKAEEFAQRAIALANTLGNAVTKDGAIVVSQFSAQETAVSKITAAEKILLDANSKRTEAEKEGAAAATAKLKDALPLLDQYEKQLAKVTELAKIGILVSIGANVDKVTDAVVELEAKLKERAILLPLIADLTDANDQIKRFKDDLEKGGVPVELRPEMAKLDAAIARVKEAKPELTVETTAAAAKVGELRKAVDKLSEKIAVDLTVKSNVADVQKSIDKLKEPTFSTHTVTIKTIGGGDNAPAPEAVPTFGRGGAVGRARGGPVFRAPSWLKVPGTGRGDTVPASLRAGSFVVRAKAAAYYGDSLMGPIARGYAGGGTVRKEQVEQWAEKTFGFSPFKTGEEPPFIPKEVFKSGQSIQDDPQKNPPLSFDTRPIPEALITAANVIQYASEMLLAVGVNNPLLGVLKSQIVDGIKRVSANPTDKSALEALLKAAETIGSNPYMFSMWEKTASAQGPITPMWFLDWLRGRGAVGADGLPNTKTTAIDATSFASKFFDTALNSAFLQRFFGNNPNKKVKRRAEGGPTATDRVPVWLTPTEWVMQPSAVQKYGSRFMHAINNMEVPRAMLANIVNPPTPRYMATGGPVGTFAAGSGTTRETAVAGGAHVELHFHTRDLSDDEINKRIVPQIERGLKRAGVLPK